MALDPSVFENSPLQAYHRGRRRKTERKIRQTGLIADQLRNVATAQKLKELVDTEKLRKRNLEADVKTAEIGVETARREEDFAQYFDDERRESKQYEYDSALSPLAKEIDTLRRQKEKLELENANATLPMEGRVSLIKHRALEQVATFEMYFQELGLAIEDDEAFVNLYTGLSKTNPELADRYFPKGLNTPPAERAQTRKTWMMDLATSRKLMMMLREAEITAKNNGLDLDSSEGKLLLDRLKVIQNNNQLTNAQKQEQMEIALAQFTTQAAAAARGEAFEDNAQRNKIVESTFATHMAGLAQGKVAHEKNDDESLFRIVGTSGNEKLVFNELFLEKMKDKPGFLEKRRRMDNLLAVMKAEYAIYLNSEIGEYGGNSNAAFNEMMRYYTFDPSDLLDPVYRRPTPTPLPEAALAKDEAMRKYLESIQNPNRAPDQGLTQDFGFPQ